MISGQWARSDAPDTGVARLDDVSRCRREARRAGAVFVWAAALAAICLPTAHSLERNEALLFFRTDAKRQPDGEHWLVPVHGWVFELDADSLWRRRAMDQAAQRLGINNTDTGSRVFRERAAMFLADGQRGRQFRVRSGSAEAVTTMSQGNGQLFAELQTRVPPANPDQGVPWLVFEAVLPADDPRAFAGRAQLLEESGVSVVSDIDDTLKVSNVLDKRALLENSFLRTFKAVAGMPDAYRAWANRGAGFHYLSASPWQLYPALTDFMDAAGYPEGSYYLREFSFNIGPFWDFVRGPGDHKPKTLRRLLERYPVRRFVLVGDSAEEDPEVYGAIAREFPQQVEHIFIRDIAGLAGDAERLRRAFRGLPRSRWTLFERAATLHDFPFPEHTACSEAGGPN